MAWYTQGGKVVIGPGGQIYDSGTSVSISALWANDGGDKVTQDETRATTSSSSVINTCWDGTNILQFGAMNEVVSFNIILEAANKAAQSVAVTMSNLVGPGGSTLRCDQTRTSANLWNWTTTECELFYVRYLQINGLSPQAYGTLTGSAFEPQVPTKLRMPSGGSVWANRPNAAKYYPEIAVPLELVPTFTIAVGHNQSIWVDVYIPKTATNGLYTGTVTVTESGTPTHTIPVQLTVRNFTLPDLANGRSFLITGYGDVAQRYTGSSSPVIPSAADTLARQVLKYQRMMAHRHKLTMPDDEEFDISFNYGTNPGPAAQLALSGSLFTSTYGYAGPGYGTGMDLYSIGTYGHWQNATAWPATQAGFWTNTNAWETWFEANAPSTQRFVYLLDESSNYNAVQTYANWMATNPGVGVNLPSFATLPLVPHVSAWNSATAYVLNNIVVSSSVLYICILANTNHVPPNATYWNVYAPYSGNPTGATNSNGYTQIINLEPALAYACSSSLGGTTAWNAAYTAFAAQAGRQIWRYNGARIGQGAINTEGDGTDLRASWWAFYKKGIYRWFEWEVTYYNDYQLGGGQRDLFNEARTYGTGTGDGIKGTLYGNNGEGVLFYPGTDFVFPSSSYGVGGPFSSLRLKHIRRGVQDVDYLTMANVINSSAVTSAVSAIIPQALWEVPVSDTNDPTYYVNAFQTWPSDPGTFEAQRLALAHIIDGL